MLARRSEKVDPEPLFAWMRERHRIYLQRKAGKPWPWTKDEILRTYKFTNVFRELDAVTVALKRRINTKPVSKERLPDRLYRIILFRAFNRPETYDAIHAASAERKFRKMRTILHEMSRRKEKVFTGAYIVTNAGSTRPKIDIMVEALEYIFRVRNDLFFEMTVNNTLKDAVTALTKMPMHGKFTSYEVVCDMRYQSAMLDTANDIMSWANTGPGAKRGISRLVYGVKNANPKESECLEVMRTLLDMAYKSKKRWPWMEEYPLEMREIEHSLCEFDKYTRAKNGEGRPRSMFTPPVEK